MTIIAESDILDRRSGRRGRYCTEEKIKKVKKLLKKYLTKGKKCDIVDRSPRVRAETKVVLEN